MKFWTDETGAPIAQGTEAWRAARLGRPTSSMFHKIITPKTMQLSASARGYAFQLVAERILKRPPEDTISDLQWLERGRELEPSAVSLYEFEHEVTTVPGGFITTDDEAVGCSPDRLLPDQRGGLEVKCPKPENHLAYLVDGFGESYIPQVMGQLWIAELDWVDRISYHPELPPVRQRTFRDEAFIGKLRQAVADFLDLTDEIEAKVRARGIDALEMAR